MSFEAVAAVMNADIRPPSLKLAAVAMGNFLNSETGQLNPSMGRIARACGLSDVQARRQVHELIAMGILSVEANHDGGSAGASRQYRMHLDRLTATTLTGDRRTPITGDTPLIGDTPLTGDRDPSHGRALPLSPVIATPLTSETLIRKESRKNQEGNKEERKRPTQIPCPSDVDEQTWTDWLTLRKVKKAPVTETVLASAQREAQAAGMPFDAFLQVWCLRGSQGLQADWLKPNERQVQSRLSFTESGQRKKFQRPTSHTGLYDKDYNEGVTADGRLK
ncbi:MAG: hypothetical protein Q8L16_26940 [Hydrogenophaga sp.]|nr:hypothetical protein [Hydrogenophaga sp.]